MISVQDSGPHLNGRQIFTREIESWLTANSQHQGTTGYLLVAGIDRLSLLNEAFGSAFTDSVILMTLSRLRETFIERVYVSRIDGDIFGLFFANAAHAEMASVAQHLVHSFHTNPLQTGAGPIAISISVGGVQMRQGASNAADILSHAEAALRVAKDRGPGRFISYNEAAEEIQSYRRLLDTGQSFMKAMKENRLRLAFQPVMNSLTGEAIFHESLIRYVDEEGKVHSADQFIPAIEKLGLVRLIDRYVMRLAVRELDNFPDLHLSVNVSSQSLQDQDWMRGVVSALRNRPNVAKRLIIEITETVVMGNIPLMQKVVRTLRDIGCRVALDDFGAGHTAFAQLKDLDINIVKIDKSFVRNIGQKDSQLFIKTLHTLAQGLGIETVGAGAETMNEARALASDGINYIQGYAYGLPNTERVWLPKNHERRFLDHVMDLDDIIASFPHIIGEEGQILPELLN